jgi:hypothetical protein
MGAVKAAARADSAATELKNAGKSREIAGRLVSSIQGLIYEEGQPAVDWLDGVESRMGVTALDAVALESLDQRVSDADGVLAQRQAELSDVEAQRIATAEQCHGTAVLDVGRATVSYCTSEVVPLYRRFSVEYI